MPADAVDSPVAKARTTKHLWFWLWGCGIFAFGGGLTLWWISSRHISVMLSDGTVVSYIGMLEGKIANTSPFEPDSYDYPRSWLMTPLERVNRTMEKSIPFRKPSDHPNDFFDARFRSPEVLMFRLSQWPKGGLSFYLEDGFGRQQSYNPRTELSSPFRGLLRWNTQSLPKASPVWRIQFRGEKGHLGELVLPNPDYQSAPRFEGGMPPLEAKTSKGTLELLSANHIAAGRKHFPRLRYVILEFNASACPDLLPCHVVGIRVTDSWGNTALIDGYDVSVMNGKTIQARLQVDDDADHALMQSADWHVQVGLCRGYGATFATGDVAVFNHIVANSSVHGATRRSLRGRELTLTGGSCLSQDSPLNDWGSGQLNWLLDKKGPLLWPILVKAIGHSSEGSELVIDPSKSHEPEMAGYRVMRGISRNPTHHWREELTSVPFHAYFKVPSQMQSFDLHVALEEPQVFAFFAKIANWPASPSKTQDSRE